MKKIFTLAALFGLLLCLSGTASAQMFKEDFTGNVGDSVATWNGAHNTWLVSSAGANQLMYTTPGLTFANYPGSGIGGATHLTTSGQDIAAAFPADSVGSIYTSFLMNVESAQTGDYFFAIYKTASTSSMYARTYIKAVTGGYSIGVSKNNEAPALYGSTVFSFGTTYLVVVKYSFVAGATNDVISAYVFPAGASFATEPATPEAGPYVGPTTTGDLSPSCSGIVLRQGSTSSTPVLTVDGIRVDSTWKGIVTVPPPPPTVSSIGTGNVPGEVAHYASLKAACDSLNAWSGAKITNDQLFYITSSLTEPANVTIGANTNGHTITFKPYTGVTPTLTFTQVADNAGLSGAWVIGPKNLTISSTLNYGIALTDSTENIVIDGSNTNGGTTRDMTIQTASTVSGNANPFRILGNCNFVTLKNTNVIAGQSVSYAVLISPRNSAVAPIGNFIPDNVTIDNCYIKDTVGVAGQGVGISASGTPTVLPTGLVIRNNKIVAMTRGVFLNYSGNVDIYGNEIYINQTSTGYMSEGIFGYIPGAATAVVNIYKNKFLQLATVNTTTGTGSGIHGIYLNNAGTFNVYDNMITGYSFPTGFQGIATGIGVEAATTAGLTANIYNNSVNMPDGPNTVGAIAPVNTAFYLNITGTTGTRVVNVKNNIFAQAEKDYPAYAYIWSDSSKATLTSNNNDLYSVGNVGKRGTLVAATLANWKTTAGTDSLSVSGVPQFVSATDLHINPTANPTSFASNAGTPIALVTNDIDGDLRSATTPDIGADEFTAVFTGPLFTPTPSSFDFKSVVQNRLVTDSVIVKNTGSDSLFVTKIAVSDSSYTVSPATARVAVGATQKFVISFWPQTFGVKAANIIFTDNSAKISDTIKVTGTCIPRTPTFSPTLAAMDFKTLRVGKSIMTGYAVKNTGTDPLIITNASIVADNSFSYTVSPSSARIDTGKTLSFFITFTPKTAGAKTALFILADNTTKGADTVKVTGIATTSDAVFSATPAVMSFNNVFVNKTAKDSIVVKNSGTDSLFISKVNSTDTTFTVTPATAKIDTGATAKFYITFAPKATGLKTASIAFTHNAGVGTDSVKVTGTGMSAVTIGEARKDANNDMIADHSVTKDTLVIYGVVTSPNYGASYPQLSYFIQDTTGAINVFGYTLPATPLDIGDSIMVMGTVAQYKGLVEFTPGAIDAAHFLVVKKNAVVPAPKRLTLHQFVTNAESYEGQLVEVDTLYKATGTWPTAAANTSIYVTNISKADTAQMFLDFDVNIFGPTDPVWPVNVVGIVSQYATTTANNNGYEIMPRAINDIKAVKVTGVLSLSSGIPTQFELQNNFPNPFNPSTQIRFALPQAALAKLVVFDMLGREVRTLVSGMLNAGYFEASWDGKNNAGVQTASGLYIYRMEAGTFVSSKKMMLLK